ncbi:MAG: SCO family protein [Ferruginibacter sp.]
MNKKTALAFLMAILLPLTGYWLVKYYSRDAVHMPHKFFYDDVATTVIRGKETSDTLWHKIRNISFTNQLGKKVSLDDAHGKILVIDFFFTRCPSICPGLARNMKKLQDSFVKNDSIVQFISISVDPEYDSVPHLRRFADRVNANHDTWWFVTGDKKDIYDFAIHELKANIADVNVDTAFIHTENFFLLDTNRIFRGFYNGFDTTKLAILAHDIPTLMLERDKKSPSILRSFIPILPIIFIGIALVMIVMTRLKRNNKNQYDIPKNLEKRRD